MWPVGGARPERECVCRQRSVGAAEARGEGRQHEAAVEHREIRVGGQTVLVAQRVQRLSDDVLAQQAAGRQHEHADARDREPLGRNRSPEIDLIADHDVGLPRAGELDERRGVPPGAAPREILPELPIGPVEVDLHERLRRRRADPRFARGERIEPVPSDGGLQVARAGDRDRVPRALRGASDSDQRLVSGRNRR